MPVDFQVGGANRARGALVPTAVPTGLETLAAGAGDFAEVFAQKAREDQEHRDRLRSVEHQGAARRRLTEGMAGLDPTADDYLKQAEELHRTVRTDIMADPGISSRGVLEDLELGLTKMEQVGLLDAVTTRHQKIEEKGLALLEQEADEFYAQIREDPDGSDAYVAGLASVLDQIGPSLRPEVLEAARQELGDKAVEARIEGLALRGDYDQAKEALKAAEGELNPEAVRFLGRRVREIQNTHQQDFHAATDGQIADVNVAIIDAAGTADLRSLREEVETMRSTGMFEGREQTYVSLIRAIESKHQSLVADNRDLTLALEQYGSGLGNDSQKYADLAFAFHESRLPEDATPEERLAFTEQFAKRSGFLPTKVKRVIENAERTENEAQLAFAAQLDERFSAAASGVDTGAGDRAALVQALHDIEVPWDEAARLVLDKLPDAAAVAARTKQFDDEYADTDWREELRDAGVAPERGLLSIIGLGTEPEISDAMALDAARATREFHKLYGDIDVAKAAAIKHLQRTYGNSNVGGALTLQKYPPERFMPIGDGSNPERELELRTAAIDGLVKRAVEAVGGKVPEVEEGQSFRLHADETTRRRLEQGLRPDYEVQVRSDIGDLMVPVWVTTKDGRRTKLRLAMPDKATADQLPEVVAERKKAEARVTARRDREALVEAGMSIAADLGSAAVTAIPKAAGKAGRAAIERHPYKGFLARNRERRKQRREER